MFKSIVSVFMATILCLASVACTPAQTSSLVTALNTVSDAASVAVVITSSLVAVGKVDPSIGNQVSVYASGIGGAVNVSVTELNSNDTNPQKIAAITAAFTKVAVPVMGPNGQQISAAIDAVSATVKIFLSHLNSAGVLKVAKNAPTAKIVLSSSDKSMLKKIEQKTAKTLEVAAELK